MTPRAGEHGTAGGGIGVIFDMDGVLVDSADAHYESWRRLGIEHHTTVTREQFQTTFGRQNRDIIPILFGPVADDKLRAMADRKEQIYREIVRKDPPVVEGAVTLVQDLHNRGVRLAVGSSGPRANIGLVLSAMNVKELIAAVVSGDDVTRGKPDPQVFLLACDALRLTPAQCVVIEDAPAGVEAAKRAGCACAAVMMHHPEEALSRADRVVVRLADLNADALVRLAAGASA